MSGNRLGEPLGEIGMGRVEGQERQYRPVEISDVFGLGLVPSSGKGAKKIDKEIERQEALLGELRDFADKLERAAKLNFGNPEKLNSEVVYDPDLNDGVVLTIAPLWELVPWKEAKKYWEELLEGKYEWSSMGKLLRKKGLVK